MTSRPRESRGDTRFALAVGLGFLLLAALGMAYHELWRDEWQSWLIATQSDSFGELIQRMRDESHTPLWLLCLYAIGKFTDRPEAMQAFHLLIATTSVFVFARYAPFRHCCSPRAALCPIRSASWHCRIRSSTEHAVHESRASSM